jgi:hypothetical protein
MTTDRTVTARGAEKRMTLGELREFIVALAQAGAADTTPIQAKVTWGGGLQQISATAVRFGDEPGNDSRGH